MIFLRQLTAAATKKEVSIFNEVEDFPNDIDEKEKEEIENSQT